MTEPITDTNYWKSRLARSNHSHEAIFRCPPSQWEAIERKHREILARTIQPKESILDAGCGWGRLLDLLPDTWRGKYLGVDVSPDFVSLAEDSHKKRKFLIGELPEVLPQLKDKQFDWAVLVSIRPMIRRNLGDKYWNRTLKQLQRVSRKILYLEYDTSDEGSIE